MTEARKSYDLIDLCMFLQANGPAEFNDIVDQIELARWDRFKTTQVLSSIGTAKALIKKAFENDCLVQSGSIFAYKKPVIRSVEGK